MQPIVLFQSRLVALRAFERVLQLVLGKGELRDCTIKAMPFVNFADGSRLAGVQLEGNFLFEGDEDNPQEVKAQILTRSRLRDDCTISKLEWDAAHPIWVNGTKHFVWFQSSKAFRVVELDTDGKAVRECARSAEYEEALTLPPEAKVFG